MENRSKTSHHWVQFVLSGVQSNRDGVGARVRVASGELVQTAEVHSGRGYQSHFGTRLHFGLGTVSRVDRIAVRWPAGRRELFRNLTANQLIILTEGTGEAIGAEQQSDK